MKKVIPILLVSFLGCAAVCGAKERHAPLPTKLLAAKTIYIENHGEAKIADRAYDELQKQRGYLQPLASTARLLIRTPVAISSTKMPPNRTSHPPVLSRVPQHSDDMSSVQVRDDGHTCVPKSPSEGDGSQKRRAVVIARCTGGSEKHTCW